MRIRSRKLPNILPTKSLSANKKCASSSFAQPKKLAQCARKQHNFRGYRDRRSTTKLQILRPAQNAHKINAENEEAQASILCLRDENQILRRNLAKEGRIEDLLSRQGLSQPMELLSYEQLKLFRVILRYDMLTHSLEALQAEEKTMKRRVCKESNTREMVKSVAQPFCRLKRLMLLCEVRDQQSSHELEAKIFRSTEKLSELQSKLRKKQIQKQKLQKTTVATFTSLEMANFVMIKAKAIHHHPSSIYQTIQQLSLKGKSPTEFVKEIDQLKADQTKLELRLREMMDNKIKCKIELFREIQSKEDLNFIQGILTIPKRQIENVTSNTEID